MFELIVTGYRSLFLLLARFVGLGWAIVALSFLCSLLMAPLMKAVSGIVKRESEYQGVILPQIAAIKEKYQSDMDRNDHIRRLYQRYSYSPLSAVRKVLPLFVQIPFLLLTYWMLKGTPQLSGVSFLFLRDLGSADRLVRGFNLLPFVMTGVNAVTVFATPDFTRKDMAQAIGIALLFLVMLYSAPSALLLYWTLNNAITCVRTLVGKCYTYANNPSLARYPVMNANNNMLISHVLKSCLTAISTSFLFCIAIPLQSYLANADLFTYSLHPLEKELFLCFAIVAICSFGTLFVLSKWTWIFHVAFLTIAVMAFLESGILSIGLPVLNGDMTGYHSLGRCTMDICIWLLVVILSVLFHRIVSKRILSISFFLLFASLVSLFDGISKARDFDGQRESRGRALIPRGEVIHSVEYSPRKNTMVFILDSISTDAARDIFHSDAELCASFPGFRHYINNVGMHWYTSVAIPGIMTGHLYHSATQLAQYGLSRFSKESFLNDFVESNIPVYANIGPDGFGYTNRHKTGEKHATSQPSRIRMIGTTPWNLIETCLFRVCPYGLKNWLFHYLNRKTQADPIERGNYSADQTVWPLLATKPVNSSLNQTLQVHHSHGGHPPIVLDKNGQKIQCKSPQYDEYVGQCHFCLRCLGTLMNEYMRMGIYDSATILVLADHALSISKKGAKLNGVPQEAFSLLMIKPPFDRTPYAEISLPTSQSKIADLVRKTRSDNLTQKQIEDIIVCNTRTCRLSNAGMITDWTIDANGNVTKETREDKEPSFDMLKPLICDIIYDFYIATAGDKYPDFSLQNGSRNSSLGIHIVKNPMRIVVKTQQPQTIYRVVLETSARRKNQVNVNVGDKNFSYQYPAEVWTKKTIIFDNIESDENNLITMSFHCSDANSSFALHSIMISTTDSENNGSLEMSENARKDTTPCSNDIRILPKHNDYNWVVASPNLEQGKSYCFRADSVVVETGETSCVEAILYERGSKRYCKRQKFEIQSNESNTPLEWTFDVPQDEGSYDLLLYSGIAGQCSDIGVLYKGVSLRESANTTSPHKAMPPSVTQQP